MAWQSYLPNSPERLSTIEGWLYFAIFLFGVLTAVSGYVAVQVRGHRASIERKELEKQLASSEKEAAAARERQDHAELELREAHRRLRPRAMSFDEEACLNLLTGKPIGTAIVEYQPENPEAYLLAARIRIVLEKAGWKATPIAPAQPRSPNVPSTNIGVTIQGNKIPDILLAGVGTPYPILYEALLQTLGNLGGTTDPDLPDNVFRILVGP
jgi:hypothetical protein